MPEIFVGRRRWMLVALAALGFVQAILMVIVSVYTPKLLLPATDVPKLALGLVGAALVMGLFLIAERVLTEDLGQNYVREIRKLIVTSALAPEKKVSLGITVARTTNDLTAVKNWVSLGISPIVVGIPLISGVVVALFLIAPAMGVAILAVLLVFAVFQSLLSQVFLKRAAHLRKVRGRMASHITDTVTASDAIRSSGGVGREVGRIDQHSSKLQAAAHDRAKVSGVMRGSAVAITTLISVLVAIVGAATFAGGATVTTAVFIAGMLGSPISALARVGEYRQNYRAATRILEPVIANAYAYNQRVKRQARALKRAAQTNPPGLAAGAVHIADLRDESGSFPELVAAPGSRVLLVGESTPRIEQVLQTLVADSFYPNAWVSVAGQHLYSTPPDQRRVLVGMASRDIPLERGSVARIVRYRVPNDKVDLDSVFQRTGLSAAVAALPKGAKTVLRRGGEPLTESERGLLKIARAMIGYPPLVVLNQVDDQLDQAGRHKLREILAHYPGCVVLRSSNPEVLLDSYDIWNVDETAPTLVFAAPAQERTKFGRGKTTHVADSGNSPFGAPVKRSALTVAALLERTETDSDVDMEDDE